MKFYMFKCKHCDAQVAYLVNATNPILCSLCFKLSDAQLMTDAEVIAADLPTGE